MIMNMVPWYASCSLRTCCPIKLTCKPQVGFLFQTQNKINETQIKKHLKLNYLIAYAHILFHSAKYCLPHAQCDGSFLGLFSTPLSFLTTIHAHRLIFTWHGSERAEALLPNDKVLTRTRSQSCFPQGLLLEYRQIHNPSPEILKSYELCKERGFLK